MDITKEELKKLNNALDYLVEIIRDVTVQANDTNTKLRYLHECNRIYQLATDDIKSIFERSSE